METILLNMPEKPIIGITLDAEEIGGYSKWHPWYALRINYVEAVVKAGGVPILLPHETALSGDYIKQIDGLIITGGDFDIDPALYGVKEKHPKTQTKPKRTDFEMEITKLALAGNKPILGICAGEQLINVILGGTLIQHVPDVTGTSLHQQTHHRKEPAHPVKIMPGSLFHKIIGADSMQVNSTHHQAVEKVGKNMKISAEAPDGIIEAIEYQSHPFCIGVQWHPEYGADQDGKDAKIFAAFLQAARNAMKDGK